MAVPVIVDAVRTPLGAVHGELAGIHPTDLLAAVLDALRVRVGFASDAVDEIVCACVEPVGGQGGNVARGAVLIAGWPATVGATTLDRGSTSGVAALAMARALVASGAARLVLAAAVDAPSTVPAGATAMGRHPYGRPWGTLSSSHVLLPPGLAAERLRISRERQEAWVVASTDRARAATEAGAFADETITIGSLAGDDLPASRRFTDDALAALLPAFEADGTITSASMAPLADGAGAIAVADADWAATQGWRPLVSVTDVSLAAADPNDLAGGAVAATAALLRRSEHAVDTVELPETFAALTLALQQRLGFDAHLVNPAGGDLALGGSPGLSDLRALVSLAHRVGRGEATAALAVAAGLGTGAAALLTACATAEVP